MADDQKESFESLQQKIRDFGQAVNTMFDHASKSGLSETNIKDLNNQIEFARGRCNTLEARLGGLEIEQSATLAKELQAISQDIDATQRINDFATKQLNTKSNDLPNNVLAAISAANKAIVKAQARPRWFGSVDHRARLAQIQRAVKAFESAIPSKEAWKNSDVLAAHENLQAEESRLQNIVNAGAEFARALDNAQKVPEKKARPPVSDLRSSSIFKSKQSQGKFQLSDKLKNLLEQTEGLDEEWAQKMLLDMVGEQVANGPQKGKVLTEKDVMNRLEFEVQSHIDDVEGLAPPPLRHNKS